MIHSFFDKEKCPWALAIFDSRINYLFKDDVYVHGPIAYDEKIHFKKMRTEEAPDLDMIYIMKGSFSEDFKNNSLVGYYDKLSPTLFIRRDLSTPDYQKVNFNPHAGGFN